MIVVTGATGFLGAHLCAGLLERGYNVRALKRRHSDMMEFKMVFTQRGVENHLLQNLQWVEADILDIYTLAEALKGATLVFHTAAIVSFWEKKREELMQTNVQGTANVVNCCLEAGARLCYASSTAALGREKGGDIIDENTPWKDSKYNTQYAISKYLAEMEVWRGIEEGLDAVIVNPGIIIGEGRWDKGSCRLIDTSYKGLKFYTPGQNGYVDVLDVCRAMIQLAESGITAQRYLLVADNLGFGDFFGRLAAALGKQKPQYLAGPVLSQIARRYYALKTFFTGKEPLITKETARNSQQTFTYKSNKIKQDLGFEFTPIDESINRICRAYTAMVQKANPA